MSMMKMTYSLIMFAALLATGDPHVEGFSAGARRDRVFVSTPASKFPKKFVSDYMTTHQAIILTPETSVDDAMDMFLRNGITGAPVVDKSDQHLVGILSTFDFLQKEAFEGSLLPIEGSIEKVERYIHAAQRITGRTVADVMATELFTVTAKTPMREAATIMIEHKLHRLPVVEGKRLVGMLTAEHVIQDLMHIVRSLPPAKDVVVETDSASTPQS